MYCLHLVGTMVYFLLNDGLEKGEVTNAVFISYWDHNLVSAKGWWLQCTLVFASCRDHDVVSAN